MGGAGLPGLVFLVAGIAVIGLMVFLVVPWARARQRHVDDMVEREQDVLAYEVPEGQDPATVTAALRGAHLDADSTLRHGRQLLLIDVADQDARTVRNLARHVIAGAPLNNEGDRTGDGEVRFVDE